MLVFICFDHSSLRGLSKEVDRVETNFLLCRRAVED